MWQAGVSGSANFDDVISARKPRCHQRISGASSVAGKRNCRRSTGRLAIPPAAIRCHGSGAVSRSTARRQSCADRSGGFIVYRDMDRYRIVPARKAYQVVVTLPVASITGRCAHGANRLQALGWTFVLPNSKRSEQQHWCRRCHSTRTRRTLSEHRFGGIAATLMFLWRHVGHVVKCGQHSERLHADVLIIGQAITAGQQRTRHSPAAGGKCRQGA